MQINFATRHGQLSPATREKLAARLEKLPHLFNRLLGIDVTVDLEHEGSPTVHVSVSAEHKHDFVANASGADLVAATDACVHKLEQQLRKYKERIQNHHRGESAPAEPEGRGAGAND